MRPLPLHRPDEWHGGSLQPRPRFPLPDLSGRLSSAIAHGEAVVAAIPKQWLSSAAPLCREELQQPTVPSLVVPCGGTVARPDQPCPAGLAESPQYTSKSEFPF